MQKKADPTFYLKKYLITVATMKFAPDPSK